MAEVRKKFGHGLEAILKHADVALQWDSCNLHEQLCAGIWLKNKIKKFWLDKIKNCNCFIIYARALIITWGDDCRYWKWIVMKESCNTLIEVAELLEVCWLDIRGKIAASMLSPDVLYEVVFVVMMTKKSSGWECPVNLELKKAGVIIHERKENLKCLAKDVWVEISVGTFQLCGSDICDCAEIEFSLFEHGNHWKRGMLVKGAIIRPKPVC